MLLSSIVQLLEIKANKNQILPISSCQAFIKMDEQSQSPDGHKANGKRSKETVPTDMDDWLVQSKSSFDHISNQILVIGTPSTFDDMSSRNFSKRLEMGDPASALALIQSFILYILK